ncbi:hypothetical protein [Streptomyces melanogenes]|uniref:hypothetical protein n=1 Tax=Streptomyces melanogenes TaxID=67326 RepID=UPI00167D48BB|nr:hypothetical protein [Streptomyces melanogenes]GGP68017.1 hypothetical protein GCM10010278_52000 [Streptomyces melanogenes]
MLTYDDVVNAPLDKLKVAVDDWSDMVGRLKTLAEEARKGMKAHADAADWAGVNAGVTRAFIGKTAKEFEDAAAEAKGIHAVLNDGYAAFKRAKDELQKIVDGSDKAGIVVDSHGKVTARYSVSGDYTARHAPDFSLELKKQNDNLAEWQRRVTALVEECGDADESLRLALAANVTDDHNFTAPRFSSLDAEEAQRAVDLASKGRAISHTELDQLNELLRDNHGSAEFATTFYAKLGPKGALEFFGQLSTDTYDYARVDKERLKDVQELQKNLGLNLATATDPDNKWHLQDSWGGELRKLGTERIALAKYDTNPPYGYQLLGGIMRYGNYDPRFLNPIAEHVVQLHQKNPYLFADTKPVGGWQKNPFNPSGLNGSGCDPVTSMLEALGHSPEASKRFFSAEPTAYNEDGTVGSGAADLGKDASGRPIGNYLDYFGREGYKSFPDIDGHDPGDARKSAGYTTDAFGHALEAATLGHAWDDPHPQLRRDETSAQIMQDVVAKYGEDPKLLRHQEALADSLGSMGAGYLDDINRAIDDNQPDSVFAPGGNSGSHAQFTHDEALKFLSTLGQHPDSYASMTTAERIYTTSMLEAQIGPDGQMHEGAMRQALRTGAEVQGMLDQSRADQVEAEGMKKHEEYEKAHAKRSAWVEFGTTSAIAAGVAFLPATAAAAGAAAVLVPLAVDTSHGAVEQIAGQVVGDWSDKKVDDHKEKIEELTREQKTAVFKAGEYSAESPMKRFMSYHGIWSRSEFAQDLQDAVDLGYVKGNSRENQQGNDPETG